MATRPVRRPDILAHDARQSTAPLVRFIRLRADERAPAHRPDQHAPRRRDLWHDSPEAAQDRRSGEDQFPAYPVLDGLGFSLRRRLRGGLGGAALGRLTTPRPTGDLPPNDHQIPTKHPAPGWMKTRAGRRALKIKNKA